MWYLIAITRLVTDNNNLRMYEFEISWAVKMKDRYYGIGTYNK